MEKRIIAVVCVLIICISVFASCGRKAAIIKGADGSEHLLVTDEEGNTVLNAQGDIAVYPTDSNGEIITYEGGEKQTNFITFPNKVVDGKKAKIETPQFNFELPEDWKTDDDGNFVYKNNENIMFEQPVASSLKGRTLYDAISTQVEFMKKLNEEEEGYKGKLKYSTEEEILKIGDKELDCITVFMQLLADNKKDVQSMQRLYYIKNGDTLIQISYVCKDNTAFDTVDDHALVESGLTVK